MARKSATSDASISAIRQSLLTLIEKSDSIRLPVLKTLVRRTRAPVRSVRAALELLEKEGIVRIARRQGIVICEREQAPGEDVPPVPAEQSLYRTIRSRIESGEYPAGEPLPKVIYLARSEHIATKTVCRVYRKLTRDGLVYRHGRMLVVGKPESRLTLREQRERRTLLIIHFETPTWGSLAQHWWSQPFAKSFTSEMALYGIAPRPAVMRMPADRTPAPAIPCGEAEILECIRQLGGRLMGILVIHPGWTALQESAFDLFTFMQTLCELDKSVVLFDPYNECWVKGLFPREITAYERMLAHEPIRKRFVRCYIDTPGAPRIALEQLHSQGHRVLGFSGLGHDDLWIRMRLNDLNAIGREMSPEIRIISDRSRPPLFDISESMTIGDVLRLLEPAQSPPIQKARNALGDRFPVAATYASLPEKDKNLVQCTARLGAMVVHDRITAAIAPYDPFACVYYDWLAMAGISVPDEMSLISFDDRIENLYPYTISSVNFGFEGLGYMAFHVLRGDIPVKVDDRRSIGAICRINHQATLSGPATRKYP
jgi:DNA-binding transcriptional regulator YhcF (GntR family)